MSESRYRISYGWKIQNNTVLQGIETFLPAWPVAAARGVGHVILSVISLLRLGIFCENFHTIGLNLAIWCWLVWLGNFQHFHVVAISGKPKLFRCLQSAVGSCGFLWAITPRSVWNLVFFCFCCVLFVFIIWQLNLEIHQGTTTKRHGNWQAAGLTPGKGSLFSNAEYLSPCPEDGIVPRRPWGFPSKDAWHSTCVPASWITEQRK